MRTHPFTGYFIKDIVGHDIIRIQYSLERKFCKSYETYLMLYSFLNDAKEKFLLHSSSPYLLIRALLIDASKLSTI